GRVLCPRVSFLPLLPSLRPPPNRGAAERRRRVTGIFPSRLRGATPCLPCDGRAPLGAPRGGFRPRDRRFVFRQCPPESAPRLRPRPSICAQPIGSRASRGRGSLRGLGTPLPAPPSGHLRRRPS